MYMRAPSEEERVEDEGDQKGLKNNRFDIVAAEKGGAGFSPAGIHPVSPREDDPQAGTKVEAGRRDEESEEAASARARKTEAAPSVK